VIELPDRAAVSGTGPRDRCARLSERAVTQGTGPWAAPSAGGSSQVSADRPYDGRQACDVESVELVPAR
jgi:hypothetical protein